MQRQWKVARIITGAFVLLLILVPAGWAQEQAEDEGAAIKPSAVLSVSNELQREKRKKARSGEWAFTLSGGVEGGYDSNIYSSPDDEPTMQAKRSGIVGTAARLEGLRYFTADDHFELGVEGDYVSYFADHEADNFSGETEVRYEHEHSKELSSFIEAALQAENDHATLANGDDFGGRFRNLLYKGEAGGKWAPLKTQEFGLSYAFQRKNYIAPTGFSDLDWIDHGPQVRYKWEIADPLKLRLWYDFSIQQYDNEQANDVATGGESAGYPAEKHFFHKALVWLSYQPVDAIKLNAKYRFNMKDDRFQGFESYKEHGAEAGVTWAATQALSTELAGYVEFRNYKHREDTPGTPPALKYDKIGLDTAARYQFNKYLSAFLSYGLVRRETNRAVGSGTSYRDYLVHTAATGLSVAM